MFLTYVLFNTSIGIHAAWSEFADWTMGMNHFQVIQSDLLKTLVGGHQQPFQMVTKNHPQKGTSRIARL